MQLRWTALVAIWTILSGPIFAPHPVTPGTAARGPSASRVQKPPPVKSGLPR